jgi:Spy/CpxP family protein refolding chaperone
MTRKVRILCVALAALALAPVVYVWSVSAQEGGEPTDEQRDERTARFEERRRKVLKNRVGLDDEKAKKVEGIFGRMQEERRRLQDEAAATRKELRALLESDSNDQKAYDEALTKLEQTHKALGDLRYKYFDETKTILTPKERAKLLKVLQQVKKAMRAERGKNRQKEKQKNNRKKRRGKGKSDD